MADVTKFIADEHARIRRALIDYRRSPNDLDAALNVCDTLWIHLTIEVEIVHEAVWGQLAPESAEAVGSADDRLHQLMAELDELAPGDTSLASRMLLLSRAVDGHVSAYTQHVLPVLDRRPDQLEMGREAFRRWQELFGERPPRTWTPKKGLANTGWGGGGKLPGSGW